MKKNFCEEKVKTLTWKEAREKVMEVNKPLAAVIDKINPSDKYKLFEVSYLFGDHIVENSVTYLPSDDSDSYELFPLTSAKINSKIREHLSYSKIPLTLLLDKNCEMFITNNPYTIPLNSYSKGSLLGVFELMDWLTGYKRACTCNVFSGARSILMLPKITNKIGLNQLRSYYNISSDITANHLGDHWNVFKEIAQSKVNKQPWVCKVLFFSKDWFNNDSIEWVSFKDYIIKVMWQQIEQVINTLGFDKNWEKFFTKLSLRNLNSRPYIINQTKHIYAIALKYFPAFALTKNFEENAPIKELEFAFLEIYGLKKYMPIILNASNIGKSSYKSSIYYSLSFPTLLDGTHIDKSTSTVLENMRNIKILLDTMQSNKFSLVTEEITGQNGVGFEFYHMEEDRSFLIKKTNLLFEEDSNFLEYQKRFPDRAFPENAPFLKGAIKINFKKELLKCKAK